MQSNALLRRLYGLLIVPMLLAACTTAQPEPVPMILTSTPRPTETRVPTVTPILGTAPNTGLNTVLATPVPTYTLLPTLQHYDPLSATQTAMAVLPTETPAPTVPPPPQPTLEPIPTGKLTGSVLGLIPSPQGLWAMRPDGTQMTLLTADPIDAISVSPGGRLAVYLTHPDASTSFYSQPYGYTVKLITLYNDLTYPIAVIDPPGISAKSSTAELNSAAQALAAYQRGAIAWSQDGGKVAFTASHEAEPGKPASSDIYIYTPSSGTIRRLTRLDLPGDPTYPYDLQWSPDGSRLFFAAAYNFSTPGTSSGTTVAGAWVTTMDGSTTQVAEGMVSSGENLLAWLPGNALLLSSNDPVCGESRLRSVNLHSGAAVSFWPGCFADMLFDRPLSELLVSVTAVEAGSEGSPEEGLFLLRLNQPQPTLVTSTGFEKLYRGDNRAAWYGHNTGQGLVAISRSGDLSPAFSGVSPDDQQGILLQPLTRVSRTDQWLWTGEPSGIYHAAPGETPQRVLDMEVQGWTSSPADNGLYFFYSPGEAGLQLYGVRSSDWQPFPIDDRLHQPGSIRWIP